jgi:hypothetical protein
MVLHGTAWFCLVLPGTAWYCLVLPGTAWYCLVLPGTAWYCLVLVETSLPPARSAQAMHREQVDRALLALCGTTESTAIELSLWIGPSLSRAWSAPSTSRTSFSHAHLNVCVPAGIAADLKTRQSLMTKYLQTSSASAAQRVQCEYSARCCSE